MTASDWNTKNPVGTWFYADIKRDGQVVRVPVRSKGPARHMGSTGRLWVRVESGGLVPVDTLERIPPSEVLG